MAGFETQNGYLQNQQSNDPQSFEVANEDYLPVFNPLKGAFQPAQNPSESFYQQLTLSYPVVPPKAFNPHIFLPDYTYLRIENQSLNIFNQEAYFYKENHKKITNKVSHKKSTNESPHYYNLIDGTINLKEKKKGKFEELTPVPIVKLNKQEVSYTQTINKIISNSPTSKGFFTAPDAMLGLVIGFVIFFLYLRTIFGKQIKLFYKSAFNRVRAVNVFEESGIITGRVSFVLNLFYFFVLGLLGMHIMDYTGYLIRGVNAISLFFILSGLIIGAYILKYIFGRLLGYLLKFSEITVAYFFHTFIFNKTYAIFIFPVLLVIPYIDNFWALKLLEGSIILYGIFYILRTFRILILSTQINISIFYLFLYLCALEIIPILVVLKLASDWLKVPVF
jgi:hypothetical protein